MNIEQVSGIIIFTFAVVGGLLSIPDIGRIIIAGIIAIVGIVMFVLGLVNE